MDRKKVKIMFGCIKTQTPVKSTADRGKEDDRRKEKQIIDTETIQDTNLNINPGFREEWRVAIIIHSDLQAVMFLYLVVELGGSAKFTILCYPEGIVLVARVNLKGEGTAVQGSIFIVIPYLKLEDKMTLGLVLLGRG